MPEWNGSNFSGPADLICFSARSSTVVVKGPSVVKRKGMQCRDQDAAIGLLSGKVCHSSFR